MSVVKAGVVEPLDGRFVSAEVVEEGSDRIRVRLDGGMEGVLFRSDLRTGARATSLASTFSVYVEHGSQDGSYVVSKDKADRMACLDRVQRAFEREEVLEGEVVSMTDGGFHVDVGVKAFLPASQIALRPIKDADEVLGHSFHFRVIRFSRGRQNVVLSRRVLLEVERDEALARLKVGALVDGVVRRLTDFGAFIDVGGAEGLLHLNDMGWGRVRRPEDVVQAGQRLKLKVLRFDKKAKRLSLGLRQVQDDPWLKVPEKYPNGTRASAFVVSKTDYGVFVEVERGVEGLVMTAGPMVTESAKRALSRVDIGDDVEVVVIDLDPSQKRMSLVLHEEM